jgi:aa3 type cytochrome c oxidase subunit IV
MAAGQQDDMQAHVKSYSLFSRMIMWGAIISLVIALLVILIIRH